MFECEIRYKIDDVDTIKAKFNKLGGKLIYPYHETDCYYIPKLGKWDPLVQNLRIRKWKDASKKSVIYFSKVEIIKSGQLLFKKSVYQGGKLELYRGEFKVCKSLLSDMGFKHWLSITKEAEYWGFEKLKFKTAFEKIKGLGIYGELEVMGSNIEKIKNEFNRLVSILEIKKSDISCYPISVISFSKSFSKR